MIHDAVAALKIKIVSFFETNPFKESFMNSKARSFITSPYPRVLSAKNLMIPEAAML
jgi:hypothetical protein